HDPAIASHGVILRRPPTSGRELWINSPENDAFFLFYQSTDTTRILHFNVTANPTATWVVQQLREAFPFDTAPRHLIFDRDAIFSASVASTMTSFGIQPTRTAWKSPWQNGVAERWVGSIRRDVLDHVVVLNERHLRRLLTDYVAYYHDDRTHLGLDKATPTSRSAAPCPAGDAEVVALPRLGGLHHRYEWRAAA
ncbi:MAG: transposase, partial [Deltaproteobacteria bacterium]|nr:transposase [Deltaproteobacteria bacterium]